MYISGIYCFIIWVGVVGLVVLNLSMVFEIVNFGKNFFNVKWFCLFSKGLLILIIVCFLVSVKFFLKLLWVNSSFWNLFVLKSFNRFLVICFVNVWLLFFIKKKMGFGYEMIRWLLIVRLCESVLLVSFFLIFIIFFGNILVKFFEIIWNDVW